MWEKLAGDASVAYEALQTLGPAPGQAVTYLRGRLQPVLETGKLVFQLLAGLVDIPAVPFNGVQLNA